MATVQTGTSTRTSSLPIGPLPALNLVTASLVSTGGATTASMSSSVQAGPTGFGVDVGVGCNSLVGGTASITPGSVLVTLSNPTPVAVDLHFSHEVAGTTGAALPALEVDVDDDGAPEYSLRSPSAGLSVPATVGSGLPIRIDFGATTAGDSSIQGRVRIVAVPRRTKARSILDQCAPLQFGVLPRLDGNLEYLVESPSTPIGVVFGFGVQPALLGSTAAGPCIGLPTPDLVILRFASSSGTLTIPSAARPLRLWSQAIAPFGATIGTSQAWVADAF